MAWENDPKKIVAKLLESRKLLSELLESIPDDRWFETVIGNEWSVSDMVIHLVGWDEYLVAQAREWINGNEPIDNGLSDDEYNREYIKTHKVNNKRETISKFVKSTKEMFNFLNGLSEKEVKYAIENDSLVDLDMYEHDMEHYNSIKDVFRE